MANLDKPAEQLSQHNGLTQELAETRSFLHAVYNSAPYVIFVLDVSDDGEIRDAGLNLLGEQLTGMSAEQRRGKTLSEIHPPADAAAIRDRCLACLATGTTSEFEEHLIFPTGEVWTNTLYSPVRDASGKIVRVVGTAFDITARKLRELAEHRRQEAIILEQTAVLNEISTPLLAISDRVVVMPLVGSINSQRAQQIMEALLMGVQSYRAAVAILDITGLPLVDTHVANVLVRASQSAGLLGAQVILTGIRPEVAQSIVGLGIDLSNVRTYSTLQAAVNDVISRG